LHLLSFIIFVVVDTQSYINITNICYENVCDLRKIDVCVCGGGVISLSHPRSDDLHVTVTSHNRGQPGDRIYRLRYFEAFLGFYRQIQ
jgi:hypothetical protein